MQKSWKEVLEQIVYSHVHSSIIYKSRKAETTQMPTDGWMDKQNVGYTYSGILFIFKKEGNSDTCYHMDDPWRHYAKWSK